MRVIYSSSFITAVTPPPSPLVSGGSYSGDQHGKTWISKYFFSRLSIFKPTEITTVISKDPPARMDRPDDRSAPVGGLIAVPREPQTTAVYMVTGCAGTRAEDTEDGVTYSKRFMRDEVTGRYCATRRGIWVLGVVITRVTVGEPSFFPRHI